MKRFLTLFLVCVLTVCMLASCGGKRFEYNYDEYLTLGNYKGVEVSVAEIEKEIEERKLVLRPKLIEAVKEARAQGDLSENFE